MLSKLQRDRPCNFILSKNAAREFLTHSPSLFLSSSSYTRMHNFDYLIALYMYTCLGEIKQGKRQCVLTADV